MNFVHYERIILIICDTNLNYCCSVLFLHNLHPSPSPPPPPPSRETSRVQIRDDILRDGLVHFIPCSRSGQSFSRGRQTDHGLRLFHSYITRGKATPWPLPLKLEFDPYPWYLITPASYLWMNWNSNRDGKNQPVSSSDSTTSRFFRWRKMGQALSHTISYHRYSRQLDNSRRLSNNDTEILSYLKNCTYEL